ncbi:hypothetical protein A3Q56_05011 [Intoshia linei]|uniref:Transporter n=1 Tax=Intoshia linei TaxID=1819745 RepID=A0A177B1F3_9BILA|nr:hypothetical protein A3Q56_05011 [Intoshia linei]
MKSFLKKFKKKEDSTDVNRTTTKRLSTAQLAHRLSMIENERGNWTGKFDFFLSCLGYAVGLGNVWRFPYLCYKNGGAVFFIPYICMLIFLGIPIFLLELTIGQFTSRGPLNCWEMAPLFKGIGVGMLLVSGSVAIYYNVIIAWAMFYMVASFKSVLPWTSCNNPWNSVGCYDKSWLTPDNCTSAGYTHFLLNGTCMGNNTLYGYTNVTMATLANIKPVSAAEDYMKCHVLGNCYSEGIGDLGPINWKMALCLLGAWVLIFLCLCRGIKSSGRIKVRLIVIRCIEICIIFCKIMLPFFGEYILPSFDFQKKG